MPEQNGMTWRDWHDEWLKFQAKQEARDQVQLDALLEVRDSLGAMHGMFETLPCAEEQARINRMAADVAALQEKGLLLRKAAEAIQPVVKPRLLVGAMGLAATVLGWEWWQRIDAAILKAFGK